MEAIRKDVKHEFNSPEDLAPTEEPKPEISRDLEGAFKQLVSPGTLLGSWVNVNPATRGIVKLIIGFTPGATSVHVFGACVPTPCDWGTVKGISYSTDVSSPRATAFTAHYVVPFKDTEIAGHLEGVFLVVESFNHFKDGSGRFDYYTRETFRRG